MKPIDTALLLRAAFEAEYPSPDALQSAIRTGGRSVEMFFTAARGCPCGSEARIERIFCGDELRDVSWERLIDEGWHVDYLGVGVYVDYLEVGGHRKTHRVDNGVFVSSFDDPEALAEWFWRLVQDVRDRADLEERRPRVF
jgi:hypothetical protein